MFSNILGLWTNWTAKTSECRVINRKTSSREERMQRSAREREQCYGEFVTEGGNAMRK